MREVYTFNGRKNAFGEFVVRCHRDGKRFPEADYFTDDRADAIATMEAANEKAAMDSASSVCCNASLSTTYHPYCMECGAGI